MNDQHRATADEWASVKALASGGVAYSCILELLHRIEALEAATVAKPNHLEIPDSSLMWRVAAVIDNGTACDRRPERIARDAIRAVAAWLRQQRPYGGAVWAQLLEREAER
jgi:hypothetical protein